MYKPEVMSRIEGGQEPWTRDCPGGKDQETEYGAAWEAGMVGQDHQMIYQEEMGVEHENQILPQTPPDMEISEEKPHICSCCGKSFSCYTAVERHRALCEQQHMTKLQKTRQRQRPSIAQNVRRTFQNDPLFCGIGRHILVRDRTSAWTVTKRLVRVLL
ncbi:unnamed protein product, partial [Ranitomeya imitator]